MATLSSTRSVPLDSTHRPAKRLSANQPGGSAAALPTILIASPATALRELWRESSGGFTTVEVTSYAQLARTMAQQRPAVLLLDRELPGLAALGSVAALQRLQPATKIVVLASRPDEKEGIEALKIGVRGYCDREISPSLLEKALGAVQCGEIWVGRKLIASLLDEFSTLRVRSDRLGCLTAREHDIVRLLGDGASNKEMAQRLNVTERTVKAHLTAVFRKLGTRSRLETAVYITEHLRAH